jgi:hypothetical protein
MGTYNETQALESGKFQAVAKGQKWTLLGDLMRTEQSEFHCALFCQQYSKCLSFSFGATECRTVGYLTGATNASLLVAAPGHTVYDLVYV